MEGGIDDVGLGVLFGLDKYRYEFAGILMHAEHLESCSRVGPHTISVPRICPATISIRLLFPMQSAMIPLPRSWHVSALPFLTLA